MLDAKRFNEKRFPAPLFLLLILHLITPAPLPLEKSAKYSKYIQKGLKLDFKVKSLSPYQIHYQFWIFENFSKFATMSSRLAGRSTKTVCVALLRQHCNNFKLCKMILSD